MSSRKKPTNSAATPTKQDPRRINFDKGDDHQVVYSNVIQVLHTPIDFQLTFGMVDASLKRPNNAATVKAVASIMLSPQHAKQLASVLIANVRKYEEEYMKLDFRKKVKEAEMEEGGYVDLDLSESPSS